MPSNLPIWQRSATAILATHAIDQPARDWQSIAARGWTKRLRYRNENSEENGPMKILIVEDEPKTGAYLKLGLTQAGFTVHLANDGWDGLDLALNEHYDLVLLDVMLPGIDGWELIRRLRLENKTVPVLFLTARDEIDNRVKGLELGADDYLVKPFAFPELLARIRTRLRRGQAMPPLDKLSIADLEIDL